MRKLILIGLLLINSFVNGQEMLGLISGNNHVTYSAAINPSSLHNSKNYLEFNLIGLGAHVNSRNIHLDLSKTTFSELISGTSNLDLMDQIRLDTNKRTGIYNNFSITLPSISYIHKRHAFSLRTTIREQFYIRGFSGELTVFMLNEALSYTPYHGKLIQNENVKMNAMVWNEINLGYSYMLRQEFHHRLAIGLNLKRLYGLTNLNIQFNNLNFTPVDNGTLAIHNMDMTLQSALTFNPETNNFEFINPLIKGKGWGFDIGLTYYFRDKGYKKTYNKRPCEIPYQDYDYRIGFSILDIGAIKFDQNSWKSKNFENGSNTWYGLNHYQFNGLNNMIDSLNQNIFKNEGSISAESYQAYLASAFSIQADFKLKNGFHLNTTWIHGFQYNRNVPLRPAVIAFTPRFEYKHFEVALPLLMYDYHNPRIGLFIKYRFLSIGSDNLGMLFNKTQFKGFDVYASITFRLKKGKCGLFSRKSEFCPAYESGMTRNNKKRRKW